MLPRVIKCRECVIKSALSQVARSILLLTFDGVPCVRIFLQVWHGFLLGNCCVNDTACIDSYTLLICMDGPIYAVVHTSSAHHRVHSSPLFKPVQAKQAERPAFSIPTSNSTHRLHG